MHTKRGGCAAMLPAKKRFLSGNVRALHRIFGEARRSHLRTSAIEGNADIARRLCTIGFLFRLRHSGRLAGQCFPGAILVSIPNASNDNVGDHTHDRGDNNVTKSWPMAAAFKLPNNVSLFCRFRYVGVRRRRSSIGRMSAFGTKADIPSCTAFLRCTMSAYDPKRARESDQSLSLVVRHFLICRGRNLLLLALRG